MSRLLPYPWRPKLCWEMLEISFVWLDTRREVWLRNLLLSSGRCGARDFKRWKPATGFRSMARPRHHPPPMARPQHRPPYHWLLSIGLSSTRNNSLDQPNSTGGLANICLCQVCRSDSSPWVSWCTSSGMLKSADRRLIEGTGTRKREWLLGRERANYIDAANIVPEGLCNPHRILLFKYWCAG